MPLETNDSDINSESESDEKNKKKGRRDSTNPKSVDVINLDTSGEDDSLNCEKIDKCELLKENSTEIPKANLPKSNLSATVAVHGNEDVSKKRNSRAYSCIAGCASVKLLHNVPTNIKEANLWFNLLGRTDLLNSSNTDNYQVCNRHFSENMRCKSGMRLYRCALPDVNLPANSVPPPFMKLSRQQAEKLNATPQKVQMTADIAKSPIRLLQSPIQVPQTSASVLQAAPNTRTSAPAMQRPVTIVQATKQTIQPTKHTQASKQAIQTPTKSGQTPTKSVPAPTKIVPAPTNIVQAPTNIVQAPTNIVQAPQQVAQIQALKPIKAKPMQHNQIIVLGPPVQQIVNFKQISATNQMLFQKSIQPKLVNSHLVQLQTNDPGGCQNVPTTNPLLFQSSMQPNLVNSHLLQFQNTNSTIGQQVPTTIPVMFQNSVQSNLANSRLIQLQTNKPTDGQLSVINPIAMQPSPPIRTQFGNQLNDVQITLSRPHSIEVLLENFQRELTKAIAKAESQDTNPVDENVIEIPQHLIVKLVFTKRGEELHELNKAKLKNVQNVCQKCQINPIGDDSILKKILGVSRQQKAEIGHKSIQCRLDRNSKQKEDKVEEKKEPKKEKKSEEVVVREDKCISTEDADDDFDLFVTEFPEIKDFRYLEDGKCECLFCGKQFESSSYAKTHLQMHREKSRLCCKCGTIFLHSTKCATHERTCAGGDENGLTGGKAKGGSSYSSSPKDRICEHCGRYSNCLIKHLDHLNSHTGDKPHKCSCGAEFRNLPNFYTHRKRFGCKNAPAEIPYGMRLRSRKDNEDNGALEPIKIQDVPILLRHPRESKRNQKGPTKKRLRRTDPDRYRCKICNMQFKNYATFRSHRTKHVTERKHVCQLCNNSYKDAISLRSHIKYTHLQKLKCKYCGKQCTPYYMAVHIRKHTGERPFSCVMCDKKLISKVALKKHKKIEHNIGDDIPSYPPSFKCTFCHAMFCSKKTLVNHMAKPAHLEREKKWKADTGVANFTCMYCNSSFEHFGSYGNHLGSVHNSHIFRKMEQKLKEIEQSASETFETNVENDPDHETTAENVTEREMSAENYTEHEITAKNDSESEITIKNYTIREITAENFPENEINSEIRINIENESERGPEHDIEMIEEYIEEPDIVKMEAEDMFNVNLENVFEVQKREIKSEECSIKEEGEDIDHIDENMIEFLNFHEINDYQIEFIDESDIDYVQPQN